MSLISNEVRKRLRKLPKTQKGRGLAESALAAYEKCKSVRHPLDQDFSPFVAGISSNIDLAHRSAVRLLMDLAKTKIEAQNCLRRISVGKNGTARFHVVGYLSRRLPEQVIRDILETGMGDRSSRVVHSAIDRGMSLGFRSLLPTMSSLQRSTKSLDIRKACDFCIPLLRDGYCPEPRDDGDILLWIKIREGVMGTTVSSEQYTRQLPEILAKVRRHDHFKDLFGRWRCPSVLAGGVKSAHKAIFFLRSDCDDKFWLTDCDPAKGGLYRMLLTLSPDAGFRKLLRLGSSGAPHLQVKIVMTTRPQALRWRCGTRSGNATYEFHDDDLELVFLVNRQPVVFRLKQCARR